MSQEKNKFEMSESAGNRALTKCKIKMKAPKLIKSSCSSKSNIKTRSVRNTSTKWKIINTGKESFSDL